MVDTLRRILSIAAVLFCGGVSAVPSCSAGVGQGRIAFADQGSIWTINPDGTEKKRLTSTGHSTSPAWSKDGRRLAFIRAATEQDDERRLYVINADGSGTKRIATETCWSPLWSPVADEIAYVRSHRTGETAGYYIAFVDTRGRPTAPPSLHMENKHIHSATTYELCDWSPDGKQISVLIWGYMYNDIEVLARAGVSISSVVSGIP